MVLSWYPQVKLAKLQTVRDGDADLFERTYAEVNRLASTMVNWFSPYDYTPYLDEEGNLLAPTSIASLADDSLHSSLHPYEAPSAQPTRSSSSYRYRNSELSDSGSSHTSPRAQHTEADSARMRESTEVQKETEAMDAQADPTAPATSMTPTATSTPPAAPTSSVV